MAEAAMDAARNLAEKRDCELTGKQGSATSDSSTPRRCGLQAGDDRPECRPSCSGALPRRDSQPAAVASFLKLTGLEEVRVSCEASLAEGTR
mmetsp:Transcript_28689/g.66809  ORF Transcript_28689/g.66809 Transcript_28689/m.66809 type:complete len:92 (+) Transcript_28689:392-667(+)